MSDNQLFDQSYARLFGEGVGISQDATPFFEAFYRNFLKDPAIRDAFSSTDMSRQVGMLRLSFFHLVAFYVSHEPSAELERIARIHSKIGIQPAFYDLWLDALIDTVRDCDPECDLPTELAWRWAMSPGLTYMRLLDRLPRRSEQQ
jgi:hemoglobin-like flavoprotein